MSRPAFYLYMPHTPARPHSNSARGARGQALILIVFAIVALVAITGLAVDGGNAYSDRRHAQNAADSAALAGALARVNNQPWLDRIYAVAGSNGYANGAGGKTVEVHSPPISGSYAGNIEYIQVRITSRVRTYFASVIGMRQITNVVEATARSKPAEIGPMFRGAAVVSLNPGSDCLFNRSFYVHSEATLSIWGGGIFINSGNKTCALVQQGEGSLRLHDAGAEIQLVGGYNVQKPQLLTPYPPVSGAPAYSYPPPIYMPKVSCGQKQAKVSEDGTTMSPGNWSDDFPPDGVKHLDSGNYCLDGDFTLLGNGTLDGSGVVIYMQHGSLRWGTAAQVDLSAPSKGDLAGLLIYQPIGNHNPMVLNAADGSKVRGTILAPGAQIKIKGNASDYGFHSQIVGYTIDADGNSNVVIRYSADENYNALTMPEVQFVR